MAYRISPRWNVTGTEVTKVICGELYIVLIFKIVLVKLPIAELKVVSLKLQFESESIRKPAKSEVDTLKLEEVAVWRVGGLFIPLITTDKLEFRLIIAVVLIVT